MNVATAIAKAMKAEGVDILFAYPVNPLIEAAAEEDIRTVIVRQERTGLHMADAYSRVTLGRQDRGVLHAARPRCRERLRGRGPGVLRVRADPRRSPAATRVSLAHYYPNFNSTLNMQHVTKWAEPLTSGRAVPDLLRRAFFQLRNGRPGPVLLEVPADVWNEEVPDGWVHTPELHRPQRARPGRPVAEAAAGAGRPRGARSSTPARACTTRGPGTS